MSENKSETSKHENKDKQSSNRIDINLLAFKSFFFFFFASIGCVFPYLSVYYKQLGFSASSIGLISGVRPIIGFCSGPLWGAIADRYRVHKCLLLCSTVFWLAFITSVGFVPYPKRSNVCPEELQQAANVSEETRMKYIKNLEWIYEEKDLMRCYITILLLIIVGELFQSPTSTLSDSATLDYLGKEHLNKYGIQRLWGSLGIALSAFAVGSIVNTTRDDVTICGVDLTISDYRVNFYVFIGCMACTFVSATTFKHKEPDKEAVKERPNVMQVFKVFLGLHYGSWIGAAFFCGACNGLVWGFLYWHLENLGASQFLMGVGTAVSHISEIIMYIAIIPALKYIPHICVLYISIICYAIRFTVYAYVTNPWWVIPTEVLQGFTSAGLWCVLTVYLSQAVDRKYLGTMLGILHGVYWGLGTGIGRMLSGQMIDHLGAAVTFQSFAVACLVELVILIIFQKVSVKPSALEEAYEELTEPAPETKVAEELPAYEELTEPEPETKVAEELPAKNGSISQSS